MRVAVTGISGHLGQLVARRLGEDNAIDAVVGIDLRTPPPSPKLVFKLRDVRDPRLAEDVGGCQALVHLAFVVMAGREPEHSLDAVNVGGAVNVFRQAAAAGIRKVVYTSSVAAYGAWPDNPVPITEAWPCRAMPDFYYARAKAGIESWLDVFEPQHPQMAIVRLRPPILVGPRIDNLFRETFARNHLVAVRGRPQLWQLVRDQDVACAVQLALKHEVKGAFNLAADDWLSTGEVARITGQRIVHLPYPLLRWTAVCQWTLHLTRYMHPGWARILKHPIVVDSTKAKSVLVWRPTQTTRDLFRSLPEYFG